MKAFIRRLCCLLGRHRYHSLEYITRLSFIAECGDCRKRLVIQFSNKLGEMIVVPLTLDLQIVIDTYRHGLTKDMGHIVESVRGKG